jgi:hypothetical protein
VGERDRNQMEVGLTVSWEMRVSAAGRHRKKSVDSGTQTWPGAPRVLVSQGRRPSTLRMDHERERLRTWSDRAVVVWDWPLQES